MNIGVHVSPSILVSSVCMPSSGTTLQSKNLQAINAGEGVEKREPSYTVGGNAS